MKVPQAERSAMISSIPAGCASFATGSPGPRGIQRIHAGSQMRLAQPRTMKNKRQPTWATSKPPTSVPSAGPPAHPAETIPFARPRSDSGKCFATTLLYDG